MKSINLVEEGTTRGMKQIMDIAEEVQDMMTDGEFDYLTQQDVVDKIVEDFSDVKMTEKEAKEVVEMINFRG